MASVHQNVQIRMREDGSREVARNIKGIGDAAVQAEDGIDTLKTALLALGAAFSFKAYMDFTGVWTDLNARVARFAGTASNTEAIMGRLMSIAQRTYAPLESTAEIYLENAFALEELGKNAAEALDYTEAMTNALVVSGAKGQRAETVIRSMAKSMLEGHLSGENWNTVLQQGGRIVETLTQETGKSLRELDRMARDRKLSSETVFTALTAQLETLREEADDMPATIEDAFIRLRNRVTEVIGTMDERLGASQGIVNFIDLINEHLEQVVAILAGVAAAFAVAFAPMVIMRFVAAVRVLFTMMAAHPFVALAAAIAGVVTYLVLMRDEIKLGVDDTTTLGDLMSAAWEGVSSGIAEAWGLASDFFSSLREESSDSLGGVADSTRESVESQEAWWLKILRVVAKVFDAIGSTIRATMLAIGRTIGTVIGNAVLGFQDMGRAVAAAMRGDFMEAGSILGGITERGMNDVKDIGAIWADTFSEEFESQSNSGLEAALDGWIKRAQEIAAARSSAEADLSGSSGRGGGGSPVDPDALKRASRELQRLQQELRGLMDSVDPVGAATRQLADAQETLNKAVAAGLISVGDAADVYEELEFRLRDTLDPLAAVNRELDENIELMRLGSAERRIEADLLGFTNALREAGVKLTEEETAALRAKLIVERELDRISQARDNILASSSGAQREQASVDIEAFQQVRNQMSEGDQFNFLNNLLGGTLSDTQSALDARLEQLQVYYDIVQEFREADVENAKLAAEAEDAINREHTQIRIAQVQSGLGQIAQLMNTHNKDAFRIGQAAAIAQVAIDTPQAAMAAFKSLQGIPYVGPVLGAAAAAAAVAYGASQISQIRSQTPPAFRTGGSWTVGGNGGVDSQNVAFRASPGERIDINTPAQARAMERLVNNLEGQQFGPRGDFTQNVTIVQRGKPDRKTAGQQARELRKQTRAEYERSAT